MPLRKSSETKPEEVKETKEVKKEAPKTKTPDLTPDQAMVYAALGLSEQA